MSSDAEQWSQIGAELLTEQQDNTTTLLKSAYQQSLDEPNTDEFASHISVAEKLQVAVPLVEHDPKQAQRKADEPDWNSLLDSNPNTAMWLSDKERMRLGLDDVEQLGVVEGGLRSFAAGLTTLPGAMKGLGDIYSAAERAALPITRPVAGLVTSGLDAVGIDTDALKGPGIDLAAPLKVAGQGWQEIGKMIRAPANQQNLYTMTAEGLGQLTGQIALSIMSGGSTALTGTIFSGMGFDQAMERAKAKGATQQQIDAAGMAGALGTALSEQFGLDNMLKRVAPEIQGDILRRVVDIGIASGIEFGQEYIEGVLHNLGAHLIYDPDAEIWTTPGDEEVSAGLAAGIMRTVLQGMGRVRGIQSAQERAEQNQQQMRELGEATRQSKVYQRSKTAFEDFASRVAVEGENPNVYLDINDADVYLQAEGYDPDEVYNQLGVAAQIEEARQTGGQVVVPVQKVVGVADQDYYETLITDIKTAPAEFSAREALDVAAIDQQRVMDEAEQILSSEEEDSVLNRSSNEVYQTIYQQQINSGTASPEVAKQNAALIEAFYLTQAQELGVLPHELFEQYELQVGNQPGEVTKLIQAVRRLRRGDVPTDDHIYGKTLGQWLAERGGVRDDGAELAGIDLQEWTKRNRFARKLLNPEGDTLDGAAMAAAEAGFLNPDGVGPNDLIAALAAEMRDEPVYNLNNGDMALLSDREMLDQLDQDIAELGLDDASPEEIALALLDSYGQEYSQKALATNRELIDRYRAKFDKLPDKVIRSIVKSDMPKNEPTVLFHDSYNDVAEFTVDESGRFGGVFAAPNGGMDGEYRYAVIFDQSKIATDSDIDSKEGMDALREANTQKDLDEAQLEKLMGYVSEKENIYELDDYDDIDNVANQLSGEIDAGFAGWEFQRLRGVIARQLGFDGVEMSDETGVSTLLFPGHKAIRTYGGDRGQIEALVQDEWRRRKQEYNNGDFNTNDPRILYQTAYHGSPHSFARFSLEKIGTGEGNQAYGYGLYFAGSKEVAEWYRKSLSDNKGSYRIYNKYLGEYVDTPVYDDAYEAQLQAEEFFDDEFSDDEFTDWSDVFEVRDTSGRLYKVDLAPAEDEYLLWDKPLSDQSEKVINALKGGVPNQLQDYAFKADGTPRQTLGKSLYSAISDLMGDDQAGSEFLRFLGVRGIKYLDGSSRGKGDGNYNYVIFSDDDVEIQEYWQNKKGPNARIVFPKSFPESAAQIQIFNKADLSSFLHESGHFFLEVYRDLVRTGQATERQQVDMQALLEWMGLESVDQIGREHHEKFARGFEVYLREGKAPSSGLQGIFEKFKSWLMLAYRRLSGDLNVDLTDEVRQVMDRMLASDAAIDEFTRDRVEIDQNTLGLTDAEFADLQEQKAKAEEMAKADVLQRALKDQLQLKGKQYRQRREQLTEEVGRRMSKDWDIRVKHILMYGYPPLEEPDGSEKIKISREHLIQMYGDKGIWKRLPGGKTQIISKKGEGGMSPDAAAELFGYESGDALIRKMVETPTFKQAVNEEVSKLLKEEFPDSMEDMRELADRAVKSLHNDPTATYLETELRALQKRAGLERTPKAILKDAAKRMVMGKRVRDLRPHDYLRNERKAERESLKAAAAGDFVLASEQKQRQLLNHYMYRGALKGQAQAEKDNRYFKKFSNPGTRKNLDRDYLDQIDAVLEAYDFKQASNKEIEQRKSFAVWHEEQVKAGNEVIAPPGLLEKSQLTNYRDMTLDELDGLRDIVKNIEHLGRLKQRLLDERNKRTFDESVEQMIQSAVDTGDWQEEAPEPPQGKWGEIVKGSREFLAEHLKPEFLFHMLDGNKHNGVWWQSVFRPLADAEDAEHKLQVVAHQAFESIFGRVDAKVRQDWYKIRLHVPQLGRSMTKSEIMSIALNWGNEGNKEAVLLGEGWSEQEVMAAFDEHMTKDDWQIVQDIWDHIDSYWKDIAALQRELTGVVPGKVQASPVQTKHGSFAGGYYPLVYDSERSYKAFMREEKVNTEELFATNFLRPATRQGHTKERVGSGGQAVKLDLGIAVQHVNNVIHDLTHRKAILQADKFLQNKRVRAAIEHTHGKAVYRTLRPWLANIASDTRNPYSKMETAVSRLRRGATAVNMGWKFSTAIVQPLGYLQSVELLGGKWSMHGLGEFYGSPREKTRFVFEKSEMMMGRAQQFDRDVRDAVRKLKGDSALDRMQQHLYDHIGFMDLSVSMPTWIGAYQKALNEGKTDADAVSYADSIVRMSQSAGGAKDLAKIQTGSEYQRMFTMFYSYFSVLHNLLLRRGNISKHEKYRNVGAMTMSFLNLVVLPALLSELILGRFPDDDDDETMLGWAARTVSMYPFMTMVGVRDAVQGVAGDYGYSLTPVGEAAKTIANGIQQPFQDDEFDRNDLKQMSMATGYIFGLPMRQMWATGEHLYSVLNDEEDLSLYELLYRNKRD